MYKGSFPTPCWIYSNIIICRYITLSQTARRLHYSISGRHLWTWVRPAALFLKAQLFFYGLDFAVFLEGSGVFVDTGNVLKTPVSYFLSTLLWILNAYLRKKQMLWCSLIAHAGLLASELSVHRCCGALHEAGEQMWEQVDPQDFWYLPKAYLIGTFLLCSCKYKTLQGLLCLFWDGKYQKRAAYGESRAQSSLSAQSVRPS